jgi:integrase/recombinase XerD
MYPVEEVPYPKAPRRLPIILTREEAIRLIDSASSLFHRAMLITMYSTGMHRAELCRLKVEDIDSTRMLIHIRQGKGGKDRDVPLSPKTLETLREYWRWMKPKTYLFPGVSAGIKGRHSRRSRGRSGGWERCAESGRLIRTSDQTV